jgi:hypothetical protein
LKFKAYSAGIIKIINGLSEKSYDNRKREIVGR